MIPNTFEYFAPTSLQEAISLLSNYRDEAKILAGGHSLIPLMKLRLASPKYIIDLGRISNLGYVQESDGNISIGALTTYYLIESSRLLKEKCPLLVETTLNIGDVQVRNKGTIGGSLAHADPAADYPAAVLALEAELKVTGPKGERTIKAADFFVDLLTTALNPDEILTEIRVPVIPQRTGTAYVKLRQKASGFALTGVAAQITLDADRKCRKAAVGITGVASKAFRAKGVEGALVGKTIDSQIIAEASQKAAEGVAEALEDMHASAEYRKSMAQVYTKRALEIAASRVPTR